jgi:hypothetical protein
MRHPLMDQSSQDNVLEGVRPPPVTPEGAVSSQSSVGQATEAFLGGSR